MYFHTQEKTTQINLFNFFTANDKNYQGAKKQAEKKQKPENKKAAEHQASSRFLFLCGHFIRLSLLTFWGWKNI